MRLKVQKNLYLRQIQIRWQIRANPQFLLPFGQEFAECATIRRVEDRLRD